MSGCDWCGYTGSGWDPEHVAHRIDPPGCGCTDCQGGYSKPRGKATRYEIELMHRGIVDDATGGARPPWSPMGPAPRVSVDVSDAEEKLAAIKLRLDQMAR